MIREPAAEAAEPITPVQVAEARRMAPTRGHTVVATLEELSGNAPEVFAQRLARSLR